MASASPGLNRRKGISLGKMCGDTRLVMVDADCGSGAPVHATDNILNRNGGVPSGGLFIPRGRYQKCLLSAKTGVN